MRHRLLNVKLVYMKKMEGAWFLYGEALRRSGNVSQAIEALKRASLLIDDDGVYRQLGFAYVDVDQYGDACKAFMTAAKIAPNCCGISFFCCELFTRCWNDHRSDC